MPGHADDAAAALRAAAGEVPVESVSDAAGQCTVVARYLQEADGSAGERLVQEALALEAEGRRLAAELALLRKTLQEAADGVSAGVSSSIASLPTPHRSTWTPVSSPVPPADVRGRDGSRYPEAAAWCAQDLPRRVRKGEDGEKTVGFVDGALTPFRSGNDETWSQDVQRRAAEVGIPARRARFVSSHVEMKVAAMMIRKGRPYSQLVINHAPCGSQPLDAAGCHDVLDQFLPKGYTLTVLGTTQAGEPFSHTYEGRG